MANPVITTLLSPNPASGNTTPTLNVETALATQTALSQGAALKPRIDLSNMADGDILEIRGYDRANSGSGLVLSWYLSFANGQTDVLPDLPITEATIGYEVSIKQTAGTARAYQWSVLNLYGT